MLQKQRLATNQWSMTNQWRACFHLSGGDAAEAPWRRCSTGNVISFICRLIEERKDVFRPASWGDICDTGFVGGSRYSASALVSSTFSLCVSTTLALLFSFPFSFVALSEVISMQKCHKSDGGTRTMPQADSSLNWMSATSNNCWTKTEWILSVPHCHIPLI